MRNFAGLCGCFRLIERRAIAELGGLSRPTINRYLGLLREQVVEKAKPRYR